MRLAVVGAGGHGAVVAEAQLKSTRATSDGIEIVGFFEEERSGPDPELLGLPILSSLEEVTPENCERFVVAVGDNTRRSELFAELASRRIIPHTVCHPAAVVANEVSIGEGSMLVAGATINTGSRIGRNVILNTGCTVDHHAVVGDHVHLAPGVHTGGNVTIAEGAFIGLGAVILPGVSVGAWAIVGAGAVVLRDVPPGATVVGNPARQIRP